MVVPRPGVTARIDIRLVGAGDIEGALVKDDGSGFEGLDVELVDAQRPHRRHRAHRLDGFFLFERVALRRLRLPPDRRPRPARRGCRRCIDAPAEVSGDKPVARIGVDPHSRRRPASWPAR